MKHRAVILAMLYVGFISGCRKEDMAEQPKYTTMTPSSFFADGKSARPLVPGTVPRGQAAVHDSLFPVTATPVSPSERPTFRLTRADVQRGQQQYDIFCSVCHGRLGDGEGMIVKRGFPHPPSFYLTRLRNAPDSHFYGVITNGFGAMYSYNDRIPVEERWKIIAYVRALQESDPANTGLTTTPPHARN